MSNLRSRGAVPQVGQACMQRDPAASGLQYQPPLVWQRSHRRYVSRGSWRWHTPHCKALSYRQVQSASRLHDVGDTSGGCCAIATPACHGACLSRPGAGRGPRRHTAVPGAGLCQNGCNVRFMSVLTMRCRRLQPRVSPASQSFCINPLCLSVTMPEWNGCTTCCTCKDRKHTCLFRLR